MKMNLDKLFDLTGKVAIVTGAGDGIGKGCAQILAVAGASVVVSDIDIHKAESVVQTIVGQGGKAVACECNVLNSDDMQKTVDSAISNFGTVNILVNNAGITRDNLLMKMSEDEFDSVIHTNLKGVFNCMKHVSRQMIKQKGGRIINISSVSGVLGNAGQANYCAAKAGVIGITKSFAREAASRGITVNAVAPGFITTDMTEVLSDAVKNASMEQIPMKQFGSADDIAHAVAFLASEEAGYITGQVLCVDGGMAM